MNAFQEVLSIEEQRADGHFALNQVPSTYSRNKNNGQLPLAAMIAIQFKKFGFTREKRLEFMSTCFERKIESTKDLTLAEARTLLALLRTGNLYE